MGRARERKLSRKARISQKPPSRGLGRKLVLATLLIMLVGIQSDEFQKVREYTEAEGLGLMNGLLQAVNPDLAQNAFMPPLMKEKIRWVYATHAGFAGTGYEFVKAIGNYALDEHGNARRRVLMNSGYGDAGKPYINIFLSRLITMVRVQYKVEQGFNKLAEHVFAVALTHEAVHLENPASFYEGKATPDKQLAEEIRTWRKVTLEVIRPLRQANQLVEIDFIAADDALGKCADPYNCPEFEQFVRRQLGN